MGSAVSMLGLAARARALISGEDSCLRAIRQKKVFLIVLASDTGANGAKKIRDKCLYYQVPIATGLSREELGRAIGKEARTVVGLTSAHFATQMTQLLAVHPAERKPNLHGGDGI